MAMQTTTGKLAEELYSTFETAERADGSTYDRVNPNHRLAARAKDLVFHTHGEMLPDDWRYAMIREALEEISDSGDTPLDEVQDRFAYEGVDIYTTDLLGWLGSNLQRIEYCDEALEDAGGPVGGISDILMRGQSYERMEVFQLIVEWLTTTVEEIRTDWSQYPDENAAYRDLLS